MPPKVLMVAEKPSVAKEVTNVLSNGQVRRIRFVFKLGSQNMFESRMLFLTRLLLS
jgi:hypothetical protein